MTFVPYSIIVMDDIEQAIDEELMKLNLDPSENYSESDDDIVTVLDGNVSSYFIYFVINSVDFPTLYFNPLYYENFI